MSGDRIDEIEGLLVGEGLSLRAAARRLGITGERVRQIVADHPDLARRVQRAREARALERADRISADRIERQGRTLARRATPRAERAEIIPTEELERIVSLFADDLDGQPASSSHFRSWLKENHPSGPAVPTFIDRLGGSWGEVCERRGLVPAGGRRGPGRDTDACLSAVRRIQTEVGAPPTVTQYEERKLPGEPARKTVAARLGDGRWSTVVARLLAEAA